MFFNDLKDRCKEIQVILCEITHYYTSAFQIHDIFDVDRVNVGTLNLSTFKKSMWSTYMVIHYEGWQ